MTSKLLYSKSKNTCNFCKFDILKSIVFLAFIFLSINGFSQQIGVLGNGNYIGDNDATPSATDFTAFGSATSRTFYIDNIQTSGNTTLSITSITLSNTTDFTISSPLGDTTIGKNQSPEPFTISLSTLGCGTFTSTVTIVSSNASNDGGDNAWVYTISATKNPEIDIVDSGSNAINNGSSNSPSITNSTEFGNIGTGSSSSPVNFTVQNNGGCDLNLTGPAFVVLGNTTDFTLVDITGSPASPITPGDFRTFSIAFNPTTDGTKTSSVTILSDDADEGTYTFTVQGTGVPPAPEINIKDSGSNDITTGSANSPSLTNSTDFGATDATAPISFTYTIENTGSADLTISSVSSSITDFAITTPSSPIASGGFTTFTITFTPSSINPAITSLITINNNDGDESAYTFTVTGEGVVTPVLAAGGLWSYLDDGSDQGTAWYGTSFDYSGWATGNAELGYGDADEATVVSFGPDSNNKYVTTYFKKSFTATGSDITNTTLVLNAVRDDGMVVYINGVAVWSNGMPATFDYLTYSNQTIADGEEAISLSIPNVLVDGVNEISVEIHQVNATSSDISFDFSMYTDNSLFVPIRATPDHDMDGIADYNDTDDDNDGLPDQVEGCYTGNLESLNDDGSEKDLTLPGTILLDDGNNLNFSYSGVYDQITSYNALDHGYSIRVHGPSTLGTLTLDFSAPVQNLFFKLIDFDENETWTVNAYDDSGSGIPIDLSTSGDVYHIGTYMQQTGNTFNDKYLGLAPNNNGDDIDSDAYGSAYFYFPNDNITKLEFEIDQPDGSTIRFAAVQYCNLDTDSDSNEDYKDSDSDNDAIPDIVEAGGVDIDGDGIIDDLTDSDGDGLADLYDLNPSSYFIEETSTIQDYDFDGDGVKNRLDLDSDNDGIVDLREVGLLDSDGNGQIDGFTDLDIDGYHDSYDGAGSRLITGSDSDADGVPNSYPNGNVDLNGLPNFTDFDADGDGLTDHTEAQATTATIISYGGIDTDGDGILDVFDDALGTFGGPGLIPEDTDSDTIPDFMDTDSDDDGELDIIEGHDTNGDGIINGSDVSCITSDTANFGEPTNADIDGDGLDDGYDNEKASYDPSNNNLVPLSHPNIDIISSIERDWREPNVLYDKIIFDGIDDYIDFADSHVLTTSFTLEAWVKQESSSLGNRMILSKRDCNKGTNKGYQLGIENNYPKVTWFNNSGAVLGTETSSEPIGTDRWYHIATIYDTTNSTVKIYIDGIEVGSNSSASDPEVNTESFLIGAKFDDTDSSQKLSDKFHGWIDEVRIWNVALTEEQLRMMMNQEIEKNGTAVRGKTIPIDIPGLNWDSDLLGYYPMNSIINGELQDQSSNAKNGRIRNITDPEPQTAPLPYITKAGGDGNWDTSASWLHGETVWDIPNSIGVDGTTIIDWNIVRTSHNIDADRDIKVLGLLVDANEMQMNGTTTLSTNSNSAGTGNGLTISHYLRIDGVLDLEGESQLIQQKTYFDDDSDINTPEITLQTNESIYEIASTGYLERDQQGTGNIYRYNDWSSPVYSKIVSSNKMFTVADVLRDGSTHESIDSSFPKPINFIGGYNGSTGNPISIANYWLYVRNANSFTSIDASWSRVGSTGNIQIGAGFLMKGTGIATDQNYVFQGIPNNDDITVTVKDDNDYLVGNPYPSAIDADKFIEDNGPSGSNSILGAIYFWDHFGGNSHTLKEYVAGHATYNLMGGVKAANLAIHSDAGSSTGAKKPGRYIAVGQAFYVDGKGSGNQSVIFKNSQRIFVEEFKVISNDTISMFFKPGKSNKTAKTSNKKVEASADQRTKFRIGFNAPNGSHRQLLIGFDERASEGVDYGFDGLIKELNNDDMYWEIENEKYVIQGTNQYALDSEFPLGLIINEAGTISIEVDALENIKDGTKLYIKDNLTGETYDITSSPVEFDLESGVYSDRFFLVFQPRLKSINEVALVEGVTIFMNNSTSELQIKKILDTTIQEVTLYNSLGQLMGTWNGISDDRLISIPLTLSAGVYFSKVETTEGLITKKIIVR
ncbi:LamG-like jellyroll fold domain-containing protein [uncultured Lutibacter sp.]|uniref:LamG-like jellyroll fold domain-containing protein n=1 Tax=uncultured Lutibacter sp. TaxID=437739 RepID=UPI0026126C39|nr:LamG-like jellyroll fold domain-containing protein [uncultured Lutibacter sp.]